MKETNVDAIKSNIKEIIVNELDVNITLEQIDETVSLYDDGIGLDSIAIINLIVLVERRFNIIFGESEISASLFSNINSLADYILSKKQTEVRDLSN